MSEQDKNESPLPKPIVSPEEPETNIKNISINNEIKNSIMESVIEENNPIVNQLIEFGYDKIYSRRVFHYLHPEDLEEALNYMAIENNIIQHRFVKNNRNKSDTLCYVCGEKPEIHLKELNINIRGHNESNDNDSNNDEDINKSKNSNEKAGGIFQVIKAEIKSEITNSKNEVQNLSFSQKLSEEKINNINNRSKDDTISENIPNIKNDTMTVTKNQKRNIYLNENIDTDQRCFTYPIVRYDLMIECEICGDKYNSTIYNTVEKCEHTFCDGCWFDFLSININENKLPSIKCLDYNCKEKLDDNFIFNILYPHKNLIKKYKRYKFELEIIKDPNKKLCPYPNCNSFLELKEIRDKDVTCLNNHTFCFNCLKKPHGKLPCDKNIDSDIIDYAKNNFVKKCPKCSIITEKNSGCNHITCSKCGYQWCWLCNEPYTQNHFNSGKCKGFQFFQPKNDYEIKLVMEGKINADDLSDSQRQFDDENIIDIDLHSEIANALNFLNIEERYFNLSFIQKASIILLYLFFGHCYFIFSCLDKKGIIQFMMYITFNFAYFFQMFFFNLIMFLPLVLIYSVKGIILEFMRKGRYGKEFPVVTINFLIGQLCLGYFFWKKKFIKLSILIDDKIKFIINIITYAAHIIISVIMFFPLGIIVNIFYVFIGIFSGKFPFDPVFRCVFNINFLN